MTYKKKNLSCLQAPLQCSRTEKRKEKKRKKKLSIYSLFRDEVSVLKKMRFLYNTGVMHARACDWQTGKIKNLFQLIFDVAFFPLSLLFFNKKKEKNKFIAKWISNFFSPFSFFFPPYLSVENCENESYIFIDSTGCEIFKNSNSMLFHYFCVTLRGCSIYLPLCFKLFLFPPSHRPE